MTKDEKSIRRMTAAYNEMRAALNIALDKATIIEREMEGFNPPTTQRKSSLSDEQIAAQLAKSYARRKIPDFPKNRI